MRGASVQLQLREVDTARRKRKEGARAMSSSEDLSLKHCQPCRGGVLALPPDQIAEFLARVPAWEKTADGKRIRRQWVVKDFTTGINFFTEIAQFAEAEDHHPDLHLIGYRHVIVELSTHAVGGLTENDFIMAAKIDKASHGKT
jgi:4a-hydroxytetrahydrobiopterin dehydratase